MSPRPGSEPYETERYSDHDVIYNPGLVTLAEDYAANYKGTFEFMRNARRMMAEEDSLTMPVARAVLNCMRMDWNVCHMLPAPGAYERPQLRVVPPAPKKTVRQRPARMRLKSRVNLPYVYSEHQRAYLVHYVSATSGITFFPHTYEFRLDVNTVCGASVPDSLGRLTSVIDEETRQLCGRCWAATADE